jgi:hypothetical protein
VNIQHTHTRTTLSILSACLVILAITFSFWTVNRSGVQSAHAASYRYTFSTFTNSDELHLYIYQSTDGLNFTKLAGPAYTPPSGLVRDASITHIGALYYVAYTDAWSGKNFSIASSPDRVHWTFLEKVTMPANTVDTWAPEWFLESNGTVNITVNLKIGTQFVPELITARDSSLKSWTLPVALSGLGGYIDTFVLKANGVYNAFVVPCDNNYQICRYTSASLGGKYVLAGTTTFAYQVEGPALFQLPNGNWRMFADAFHAHKFVYSDSSDGLKTWTAQKLLPGLSGIVRHGTVLRETV